ncbi:hypothetical protein KW783_00245 [Candidatus Parcubacteria bacterium]|nr:hypothetical protein [Candidatus Parcubacteria bacterium]
MQQKIEMLLEQDVITGFSYSFTKCLLQAFKRLHDEKRVFLPGATGTHKRLTDIAQSVMRHLSDQLSFGRYDSGSSNDDEIRRLIMTAEEFLSIFIENHGGA